MTKTVHTFDASQRFFGLEVGGRMTALAVDGMLLLHSPISATPDQVLEWLEPLLAAAAQAEVEVQVPTSWSDGVRRLGWKLEATGVDAAEVDFSGVNPHDRFGRR